MRTLLTAMLLPLAALAASAADRLIPGLDEVARRGVLRAVVSETEFPPFYYKTEKGGFDGVDIRMLRAAAKELGVRLEVTTPGRPGFDAVVDVLAEGRADVAASFLSITPSRARRVLFTEPYLVLKSAIMANSMEDSTLNLNGDLDKIAESDKISIGVLKNSAYSDLARKLFPKAKIVEMDDWDEIVRSVRDRKIYGGMRDEFHVRLEFVRNPRLTLSMFQKIIPDSRDPIAVVVNPANPALRDWLNIFLRENADTGKKHIMGEDIRDLQGFIDYGMEKPAQPEKPAKPEAAAAAKAREKEKSRTNPFSIMIIVTGGIAATILALFSLCPKRAAPRKDAGGKPERKAKGK